MVSGMTHTEEERDRDESSWNNVKKFKNIWTVSKACANYKCDEVLMQKYGDMVIWHGGQMLVFMYVCACALLKWTASSFLSCFDIENCFCDGSCVCVLIDLYIIRIKFNGWCMRFSLHQCGLFDNCYRSADKWNFSRLCAICVCTDIKATNMYLGVCVCVCVLYVHVTEHT